MVQFRGVSKNDRDCGIDYMWPVCYITKRNNKCFKKTTEWFPPLNFSSVDGAAELWVSNATEVNYTTWQPPCWDFDWRDDSYIRLKCLDTVVFPDAITQGDTFSPLNPPLVWSGELPYEGSTPTQRNYGARENMTLYAAHTSPQKTIEKLCKVCRFI